VPPVPAIYEFTVRATANDDAYTITPHLTFTSPLSVRDNDDPVNTTAITGFGATLGTANGTVANGTTVGVSSFITIAGGGRVYMNPDGTFVFYPDAGVSTGTASFFYTITGGDTAQVNLNFDGQELVWFVNLATPTLCIIPNNIGTQACPDSDVTIIETQDSANDTIYFAQAGADYFCEPIILETGGRVVGDGSTSTLATVSGVTPALGSSFPTFTGTHPVLNNAPGDCITLSSNNRVDGITIRDTTTGYAIASAVNIGASFADRTNIIGTGGILNLVGGGTLTGNFANLSSASHTASPINLVNMAGTITTTTGAITNAANADVIAVSGGTVSLTMFPTVSKTGGTGALLNVTGGHAVGTLNFLSGISHSSATGGGVQFNNADGIYIVNGNLAISAGTAGVHIDNGSAGSVTFVSAGSSITGVNGISFRVNNSFASASYAGSITHTSGVTSGIQVIDGTGTISFDGNVQIGTVPSPMLTGVGVLLDNTGVTNLISFANLNIISGINGGIGAQAFVSQTSGRIAVTTGALVCDGTIGADNHCFDVSNTTSSGVTFASILSDHNDGGESGGAIFLNTTPGTFTFQNFATMTGNNAGIIQAAAFGTLNVGTVSPGSMTTSNRPVLNINNGAININATTSSTTNSPTHGIRLISLSGTGLTVSGTTMLDLAVGATGNGILMQDITTGIYNFSTVSTVTITDRTNEGIYLNNVDGGAVAFGNTTINNPTGATESAVRAENGSSSVAFAQANINQGNSGTHEGFTDAFTPSAGTGEADAVYFNAQTGGLTISGGTIQNVADDGIDIRGSTGLVLNNVTITNTGLSPTSPCGGCNSSGVQGFNLIGTVTVNNSSFTNGRIRNFYVSNTAGALTFTLNTSTFDDTRTGGVGTDNLQVYLGGTASANIDINGGTFTRSRTNQIEVTTRDTANVNQLDITGITMNHLGADSSGISINGLGNSNIAFNVANNPTLYSQDENVIAISAGEDADVQGRVIGNPDMRFVTDSLGGSVFNIMRLLSDGLTSTVTVLIENNIMSLNNGTDGINGNVQGTGSARINATINNNNIFASGTGGIPLDAINAIVNSQDGTNKTFCLTINGNNVTGIWARAGRARSLDGTGSVSSMQITGFNTDFATTWLARGNVGSPVIQFAQVGAYLGAVIGEPPAVNCPSPTNPGP